VTPVSQAMQTCKFLLEIGIGLHGLARAWALGERWSFKLASQEGTEAASYVSKGTIAWICNSGEDPIWIASLYGNGLIPVPYQRVSNIYLLK